jgi:MerR family mercuric resistance operon transcriptional regulator
MSAMTIGMLAKAAGVHVETIRYYHRRGLLPQPRRLPGTVRRYGEDAAARVRFVKRAQELGFSLEDVKVLVRLNATPNCRGARDLAARKLAAVESRLADLQRMRSALASLIAQCEAGGERSCPVIERLTGAEAARPPADGG